MKLSAIWIAKNEEKTLPRSMQSVAAAVDEMVVIDTGSSDRTVAVAEENGARVAYFEWVKDFAAARNFALMQATGDIAIFLDADEWFEPALIQDDKMRLEAIFQAGFEVVQIRMKQLTKEGAEISEHALDRVLRLTGVHYKGRIHETMERTDGSQPKRYVSPDWVILHSGYYREVLAEKSRRNIELLEEEIATTDNEWTRYVDMLYLVREYKNAGEQNRCAEYLRRVLDNPKRLREYCQVFNLGSVSILYELIESGYLIRYQVSRLELKKKIFELFPQILPRYRGTASMELYYQVLFDFREDRLLADIDRVMEKAVKLDMHSQTSCLDGEAQIYSLAAGAQWRRGNYAKALDYAVASIRRVEAYFVGGCGAILLRCIKGQPLEDSILFLNSVYDTKNTQILGNLTDTLIMEGYRDVYLYYMKRQIDGGAATQGDFLYYLLVLGDWEKALEHAHSLTEPENEGAVAEFLFLLAICSGEEDIYREHAGRLIGYGRILDAYFAGEILTGVTPEERAIFSRTYRLVAFYLEISGAKRYCAVFAGEPLLSFRTKAAYYTHCGRPDLVLEESMVGIKESDFESLRYRADACLALHKDDQAYHILAALLERELLNDVILNQLLVVAERNAGELGAAARQMYDRYQSVYDKVVDLRDMVNSKYAVDPYTRKQLRALGAMTLKQLNLEQEAMGQMPLSRQSLDWVERAAALYLERKMYGPAQECLRICIAKDYHAEESKEKLKAVLLALGNASLAKAL